MVTVAAVQMASVIGEVDKNLEKARRLVEQAALQGANLVCLPELFNTGYFCHTGHFDNVYFDLAEPLDGKTITAFRNISRETGITIIVPFFEYSKPGVYYNSACLINERGEIVGCYRKAHIPWSMTGWEKFYMRPGYELSVYNTSYGKVGIMICYDRDFPETARTLGLKGAEIIVVPNGAPAALTEIWKSIMQTRAYENQTFVVGACLTGRTDEEHHEFSGHSLAVNPFGQIEKQLQREEGILLAELDLSLIHQARKKRFLYRDRRPEIYANLTVH